MVIYGGNTWHGCPCNGNHPLLYCLIMNGGMMYTSPAVT